MNKNTKEKQTIINIVDSAIRFKDTLAYKKMFQFIAKCKSLAAFNAMLVFLQNPQVVVAMTNNDWQNKFNRKVKENARAYIILWPFGPINFAYSYEDTFALEQDKENMEFDKWFKEYKDMYKPQSGDFNRYLFNIQKALPYYGICLEHNLKAAVEFSAYVQTNPCNKNVQFTINKKNKSHTFNAKASFLININEKARDGEKLTAIMHELAHIFLRHLPSPNNYAKLSQRKIDKDAKEMEAELVKVLVCQRLGIEDMKNSIRYIASYVNDGIESRLYKSNNILEETINVEKFQRIKIAQIMQVADLIESISKGLFDYKKGFLYKYDKDIKDKIDSILTTKDDKSK